MYICTKCLKGDCKRCKTSDTKSKEAYKCDKCGHIHYVRKPGKQVIKDQITRYREKIIEMRKEIKELERLM